jgi:type II secretory pathway pseudopilin PulG
MIRLVLAALTAAFLLAGPAAARSAQANVEALLAADRAFSAAAARAPSAADGLGAMFDADIVAPFPGRGLIVGRDPVIAGLRAAPGFGDRGVSWAPVRGGISADGSQGFTFGFLSLAGGDPTRRDRKYLAYWVHRPQGWRVVAWRATPRQPGAVSTAMMAPSLPGFAARERRNAALMDANRAGLAAAEHAFSDRAQQVGLRVAFREFGREDAMNMYRGAGFDLGLDAVTGNFDAAETVSPVSWSTEHAFVASSGDLGVSIGTIRPNHPGADGRTDSFPFFTVWRRDGPNAPWRYIAE